MTKEQVEIVKEMRDQFRENHNDERADALDAMLITLKKFTESYLMMLNMFAALGKDFGE